MRVRAAVAFRQLFGMERFQVCGVLATALFSPLGAAQALPILNPGFEQLNVTLRPGEQTNGAGGAPPGMPETAVNTRWPSPFQPNGNSPQSGVLVPGWRTLPNAPGSLAGILNPNVMFNDRAWMAGYSGNHVAAAQAAFMQQTLNVRLAPDTTYTLSFLAGIGITDSEYWLPVQLLAAPDLATFATPSTPGVDVLARMPFTSISREMFGTMRRYSFSYTTPVKLPGNLRDKYIAISFLGSDGIPRVVYDDFQLEAVPAPGALCIGIVAGVLAHRRRRQR